MLNYLVSQAALRRKRGKAGKASDASDPSDAVLKAQRREAASDEDEGIAGDVLQEVEDSDEDSDWGDPAQLFAEEMEA